MAGSPERGRISAPPQALLELDPPEVADCLFHLQQAVEKATKAALTAQDLPVKRTHDLISLGRALRTIAPDLGARVEALAPLGAQAGGDPTLVGLARMPDRGAPVAPAVNGSCPLVADRPAMIGAVRRRVTFAVPARGAGAERAAETTTHPVVILVRVAAFAEW